MVVTIKKTSWGRSRKFEVIEVMFNFNKGNTIIISRSIRCKKTSIFENFLVVKSFFLSNYRLTVQSSNYILK